MGKRTKQKMKAEPDMRPEDICLLGDNLYQAQCTLKQLSKDITNLVLKKNITEDQKINAVGLDVDLLNQVFEIAKGIGRAIADWSKMTIGNLSMLVEEIRSIIGLKQKAF